MFVVMVIASLSAGMICEAISKMPGNENFHVITLTFLSKKNKDSQRNEEEAK
jgi:hypothetical protein